MNLRICRIDGTGGGQAHLAGQLLDPLAEDLTVLQLCKRCSLGSRPDAPQSPLRDHVPPVRVFHVLQRVGDQEVVGPSILVLNTPADVGRANVDGGAVAHFARRERLHDGPAGQSRGCAHGHDRGAVRYGRKDHVDGPEAGGLPRTNEAPEAALYKAGVSEHALRQVTLECLDVHFFRGCPRHFRDASAEARNRPSRAPWRLCAKPRSTGSHGLNWEIRIRLTDRLDNICGQGRHTPLVRLRHGARKLRSEFVHLRSDGLANT
mmetsp:Transcript_50432/g.146619  ORF Transcript_50432/g.146619 Transcript_50432/m.146619 type:complete len:263 (-) Transcript_50432:145-933(-)